MDEFKKSLAGWIFQIVTMVLIGAYALSEEKGETRAKIEGIKEIHQNDIKHLGDRLDRLEFINDRK